MSLLTQFPSLLNALSHRTRPAEEDAGFLDAAQIRAFSGLADEDDHTYGRENLKGDGPHRGRKGGRNGDIIEAVKRVLVLAAGATLFCNFLASLLHVVFLLLYMKGGKTSAFSWVLSVGSVDFTRRKM